MTDTTGFREPMLAQKLGDTLPSGKWIAERKYDGHRLIVSVTSGMSQVKSVVAWSRLGNERALRSALRAALEQLPDGVYDGELIIPGGTSQHVKDTLYEQKTELVLFDVLTLNGEDMTDKPLSLRRFELYTAVGPHVNLLLHLSDAVPAIDIETVTALARNVWKLGQEGLILKDLNAPYRCGKRSKSFLKLKQEKHATLTVRGFIASEGEIVDRGPYASVVIQDGDGYLTVVKTLDDDALRKIAAAMNGRTISGEAEHLFKQVKIGKKNKKMFVAHPWVGRKLCIDYQERTPDGSYRHPRWDRWAEEDE